MRERAGLSQAALAEKVFVSRASVSYWEHDTYPQAALLPSIAAALGCTIDELYGDDIKNIRIKED